MNLSMLFCSSKGFENTLTFKNFTETNFYIPFCDRVPLSYVVFESQSFITEQL